MAMNIYMDNAATTKVDPRVLEVMLPYFTEYYGNASSIHSMGYKAKVAIEEAREKVAELINANPQQIYFTSGATESNNWVIKKCMDAACVITTAIEHDSVYKPFTSNYVSFGGKELIDSTGKIKLENIKKYLQEINDTALLSIMFANNEIGTIQPIKELTNIAHSYNCWLHTDATQALGHVPIDVKELDVDYLSASAHKLYGPKGVGCLYIKNHPLFPYMEGGHQEDGLRAGTYNVPGIVGFGEAARLAKLEMAERIATETYLRNYFINRLHFSFKIFINGSWLERLPNNINVSILNVNAEELVLYLSENGISCSTGSACNSGIHTPSRVLQTIGVADDRINNSIRFSISYENTIDEIDYVINTIKNYMLYNS